MTSKVKLLPGQLSTSMTALKFSRPHAAHRPPFSRASTAALSA
jgi:hypothetical protein